MAVLKTLGHLLKHLPAQLPSPDDAQSCYRSFMSFGLDLEILEILAVESLRLGSSLSTSLVGKRGLLVIEPYRS